MSTLTNKILGGLYGQAMGDAWGMPAYFDIDQTWEAYGGWITEFLPGPADHPVHFGLPAGRITDDSEQAFSLAQAFIRHGEVSLQAAVEGIMTWYDRVGGDTSPYVGPSTRRGVNALKRGDDPHTTGLWGDTNGAPMRISPVGLLHPGDPMGAIEDAALVCIPTHNTNVAISGACAVASAIAIAMMDNVSLDTVISAGILGAELGRKKGRAWLGPSVARRIHMAIDIVEGPGSELARLRDLYNTIGTSLSVPETVGSAFGVLVMAKGDPKQTAIYAANLSGDADTVGAIACAIAGAYAGIEAFPQEILAKLDADEVAAAYNIRAISSGLQSLIDSPSLDS
ncbi:MAG: ADP-ribosylglycohydrolase family protein [Chloroflexi bacterium]|nr:ADP-ribosylglycohydrolase family protein [Chloroflexota bacterium]